MLIVHRNLDTIITMNCEMYYKYVDIRIYEIIFMKFYINILNNKNIFVREALLNIQEQAYT